MKTSKETSGQPKKRRKVVKSNQLNEPKNRFGFNVQKDIALLQTANPWQLGGDKWSEVSSSLSTAFGYQIAERTGKDGILLLVKKFSNQELSTRTGTEEEKSERGALLETVVSLIEEERSEINKISDNNEFIFTNTELEEIDRTVTQTRKEKRNDREAADKERETVVTKISKDFAPEPSGNRRIKPKVSMEEELITIYN